MRVQDSSGTHGVTAGPQLQDGSVVKKSNIYLDGKCVKQVAPGLGDAQAGIDTQSVICGL